LKRKNKIEKKAVTKNKKLSSGGENKIKRNVINVEFCARRRVIF